MGTAFRSALIAGLRTDAVELVPTVPDMFGWYYPDAAEVVADPNGRIVIADGRNHLELSDERFDIIVTDPPPPIESSGASVISSKEYYEAGRDHLTPGGVMMQWVPYGASEPEFKEHIRTFAAVFPHVLAVRGAGGYGAYLLGSDRADRAGPGGRPRGPARPGVLEDISTRVRLAGDDDRRMDARSSRSRPGSKATPSRRMPARSTHHGRPTATRVLPPASPVRDSTTRGSPAG